MKKPNIKALAIDHGEKIAFGVFAVIVLGVLATSNWSRFARTPDELKRKAADAKNKFSGNENVWPKTEEETYKVVDYSERSRRLFTPLAAIAGSRFNFSTPIFHPLYRKDEPRREPIFEPVQQLMAKGGLVALSISASPEMPETPAESKPTEEMPADSESGGEFGERRAAAAAAVTPGILGRGGAPSAPASSHGGGGRGPAAAGRGAAPTAGPAGAAGAPGINPIFRGMPEGAMMAGGPGMMGGDTKARGERFIAVRGVFPLRKQIENFRRALHISEAEASSLVELLDFVLERQAAKSGDDPWKDSTWETVSLETARSIIKECTDLDTMEDPVPVALQDDVITMGLPMRLRFGWGDCATHPRIQNELLSKEGIELENQAIEALDQATADAKLEVPGQPKKRGLSGTTRDLKGLVRSAASNPGSMEAMRSMYSRMPQMGGSGGPAPMNGMGAPMAPSSPSGGYSNGRGGPGAAGMGSSAYAAAMGSSMASMGSMGAMSPPGMRPGAMFERMVSNNSQYLLFRYLDFDVKPGMAYRYRVRLILSNPNANLSPEELGSADPEIAEGDKRETAWSNISNPEVVPSTNDVFLKQVEREPYLEEKIKANTSKPVAQLAMFDWNTDLGTTIHDILNIPAIGAFIGEEKKDVMVLKLVEGTLDKEKHMFASMNVLLDVESDVEVAADQHPDLKFPGADKRGNARVGVMAEAVIATELGEIKILDPVTEKSEEQKWLKRAESERRNFKEGAPAARTTSRLTAWQEKDSAKDDGKDSKSKSKRNPRRAGPEAMGNSMGEMMRQMMQGSGAAPPPANAPGSKKKKAN